MEAACRAVSAAASGGDVESALAAVEAALALDGSDSSLLHAKLVALIELSRYEEALPLARARAEAFLSLSPLSLSSRASHVAVAAGDGDIGSPFELAYCLYQLGREDEALETLASMEGRESREAIVLAAQILYRKGRFSEAAERFEAAANGEVDAGEVHTNVLAALALGGQGEKAIAYAAALPEAVSCWRASERVTCPRASARPPAPSFST